MQYVILTQGEYSDYSLCGLVGLPDEVDLKAELVEWKASNSYNRRAWHERILSMPGAVRLRPWEVHQVSYFGDGDYQEPRLLDEE